jgi:hypothetical protein
MHNPAAKRVIRCRFVFSGKNDEPTPDFNSAYHARAKTIGVSLKSVYNKLDNLETGISAAMVGATAERLCA